MKVLVLILSACAAIVSGGLIEHDHHDGHKATSYQNIHIEHFHAVPTYVKKEDHHLLEHPISKGKTTAEVKIHHGGKHDHGYGISSSHTDLHGHEQAEEGGYEGAHQEYQHAAAVEEQHEYQPQYEAQHGGEYEGAAEGEHYEAEQQQQHYDH